MTINNYDELINAIDYSGWKDAFETTKYFYKNCTEVPHSLFDIIDKNYEDEEVDELKRDVVEFINNHPYDDFGANKMLKPFDGPYGIDDYTERLIQCFGEVHEDDTISLSLCWDDFDVTIETNKEGEILTVYGDDGYDYNEEV